MCKCYVSLFICCVTPVVHSELTAEINSNSAILALGRFISHHFKVLNKLLGNLFRIPLMDFNEWLVSTVKSILQKVLWKAYLSWLELYTVLTETEKNIKFALANVFESWNPLWKFDSIPRDCTCDITIFVKLMLMTKRKLMIYVHKRSMQKWFYNIFTIVLIRNICCRC